MLYPQVNTNGHKDRFVLDIERKIPGMVLYALQLLIILVIFKMLLFLFSFI